MEWLEFNNLHGVDHFFVYTFHGTDAVAEDVLQPYLQSGLATRIHFQHYPVTWRKCEDWPNLTRDLLSEGVAMVAGMPFI